MSRRTDVSWDHEPSSASIAALDSAAHSLHPIVELARAALVRSLRARFDSLCRHWTRYGAPKEAFNRWIYLQLGVPDSLYNNASEFSLDFQQSFGVPLNLLHHSGDPLLPCPTAASRSAVLTTEMLAEIPVRCHSSDFSAMKPWKFQKVFESFLQGIESFADEWLDVHGSDWRLILQHQEWLRSVARSHEPDVAFAAPETTKSASLLDMISHVRRKIGRRMTEVDLTDQLPLSTLFPALCSIAELISSQSSSRQSNHKRSFDGQSRSQHSQHSDNDASVRLLEAAVRHSKPLVEFVFRPRVQRVCQELASFCESELSKLSAMSKSLNISAEEIGIVIDEPLADSHARVLLLARDSHVFQSICTPAFAEWSHIELATVSDRLNPLLLDAVAVSKSHLSKLRSLFAHSNLSGISFSSALYCMLRRYQTLIDSSFATSSTSLERHIGSIELPKLAWDQVLQAAQSETFVLPNVRDFIPSSALRAVHYADSPEFEGAGFHAAAPESLFRTLKSELGVDVECFASPLNAFFGSFCSAFADTDRYFGSHGSFFNLRPEALSGSFECNPPFVDEVMFACALHIDHLLSSALPLSITVIVPHWVDTRFIPHMHQSQYCRRSLIVPAGQHRYVSGSQHHVGASELHDQRQMLNSRYFQAAHDTIVFVLQNDAGAAKWPIDEQKCDRILKGFA